LNQRAKVVRHSPLRPGSPRLNMPPKFDDFKKPAGDVLGDDFFVDGYEIKAKAKSSGGGGSASTVTVNLNPRDDKPLSTGKVSLKIPAPYGLTGLSINKLEMDKKGVFKLEGEISEKLHKLPGLKLEGKLPNVKDYTGSTAGLTFSGLKMNVGGQAVELQAKADVSPFAFDKSSFEITKSVGPMACFGVKAGVSNLMSPSFACRLGGSCMFAAIAIKPDPMGAHIDAHGFYKMKLPAGIGAVGGQEIKFGANCCKKGVASPNFGLGMHFEVMKGAHVKAKVEQTMDKDKQVNSLSASAKYTLSPGVALIAAAKMRPDKPASYGFQLSVE